MKNVFAAEKTSSVSIAKERLKLLLVSDRANCTPDTFEKLKEELYYTISKYIEITPEMFEVDMTPSNISITLSELAKNNRRINGENKKDYQLKNFRFPLVILIVQAAVLYRNYCRWKRQKKVCKDARFSV